MGETNRKTPGFAETEIWTIQSTVNERYGRKVSLELAEAEVRLNPEDRRLTVCPAVYWDDGKGCHFVIVKLGESRYRCQFYYRGFEQFGTGRDSYDDLPQCVVTLLQVQADYERDRQRHQESGEQKPDSASSGNEEDDSYKYSPLYWGD